MSSFCFIDEIVEFVPNKTLSAVFTLKGNEEFLGDHFDGFPVMPGVLLLESLRQAASALGVRSEDFVEPFFRLSQVGNVKFGQFVKPGSHLRMSVRLLKKEEGASFFEGRIDLMDENGSHRRALSADFALVPIEGRPEEKAALAASSRLMHERLCKHG